MQRLSTLVVPAALAFVGFVLSGCDKPVSEEGSKPQTPPPAASASANAEAQASAPEVKTAPAPSQKAPAAHEHAAAAPTVELKDPVATVDGEPISRAELDAALGDAAKASGINLADLTAEQKLEGYRQILDDLIMDKIISRAAAGIKVTQEEVTAEIAKFKSQFPSEEEFKAQLTAVGQTPEKLTDALTKLLRQRQWVESQIGKDIQVAESDAKKFYDEHTSEFERPEQVRASHILFLVKPTDSEDAAKAQQEKAKAAVAKAKAKGADFNALAKELSEEPGAKESGGDLGYFPKERMVPEFSEAAFGLKPGQISEPIKTRFGWHVIKVEDRKPAETTSFDEIKEQLEAYLKADKERKAVTELMEKLRGAAKVESTLPPAAPPALDAPAPATDAAPAHQH